MKKIIMILLTIMSSFAFAGGHEPLQTVKHVDLERYIGKWYEIARFDQKFQKNCTAVTATYSKRRDGDIKVLNTCRLYNPTGKSKQSIGRAWVNDKVSNAKLRVQFFLIRFRINSLAGNYWIIELDQENYSYAVIGDPTRRYLWILSRSPQMEEGMYNELVTRARGHGFDTSKLLITPH